jgi:hypothetical protein
VGAGWVYTSGRLNITKPALKAKKKGQMLLSRLYNLWSYILPQKLEDQIAVINTVSVYSSSFKMQRLDREIILNL